MQAPLVHDGEQGLRGYIVKSGGLIGPVLGAAILIGGYVGYQEFSASRAHRRYCEGLVIIMRMHKGEGKLDQLYKEFDTLTLRCPEAEWSNLVISAPGPW